jgi:hypothetical protein
MSVASGTIVPFSASGIFRTHQLGGEIFGGVDGSIVLPTWAALLPHKEGISKCVATVSAALDIADRPAEGLDMVFRGARDYLAQFQDSVHFWDLKKAIKQSLMQKHVLRVNDTNRKRANHDRIDKFMGLVQKDKDSEFMNR